jgi:hypothetical protein
LTAAIETDARPRLAPGDSAASGLARRSLHFILFATIFSSALTFQDPSVHEALVIPLIAACIAARVTIDIKLMPYIGLWVIYLIAGLAALAPVAGNGSSRIHFAFSAFLVLTGIIYACLFSQDCMRRFAVMRAALVLSCTIASILGIVGYFQLVPGELFTLYGRARGATLQPNIFGALLVFPILLIVERFVTQRISIYYLIAGTIILWGLLLSFSRGSWTNCIIASALTLLLIFLTTNEARVRQRTILFAIGAGIAGFVLLSIAFSIPAVWETFQDRFRLLQDYDVGSSAGRFSIQSHAIDEILRNPNGLGPLIFTDTYGSFPHNSFLHTALNHGWLGGSAYLVLILSTLLLGLRCVFIRAPWQSLLIVSYAAFFGTVLHSFVEDPERQRPFYLYIGLVWGLSVASLNALRSRSTATMAAPPSPPALLRVTLPAAH